MSSYISWESGGLESHNLIHMVSLDGNACSSLSLSEFQIQQTHSVVLSITRLFALGTPGSNCSCCFWFCGPELLRLFFTSFRFLHEEVKPAFFSHHGNCISKRKRSKHAGLDKHRHYIDTVKKRTETFVLGGVLSLTVHWLASGLDSCPSSCSVPQFPTRTPD